MRRVQPGPEREAFVRRIREQWATDEAALRRAPFPILGLTRPFPNPVGVSSYGTVDGHIADVGLRYGAPGPALTPLVIVTTARASGDRGRLRVADVLRNALTELEGAEQPVPPGRREPEVAEVLIEGVPWPTSILNSGQVWAAVAEPHVDDVALQVTIAGRDWPLSGLAPTRVDDLEPYFAAKRERIEALDRAGAAPGPETWDLPPTVGLAAHQALADRMIAITRERMAAGFPFHGSLGSDYARLWEAATRAQMALADQSRADAEDSIHSVINHLCQLAESTTWFANSNLADKAIAETLEYVAYGRDVRSAEAQKAWSRYWGLHGQEPPAFESLSSAEESWRAAWQQWVEHR